MKTTCRSVLVLTLASSAASQTPALELWAKLDEPVGATICVDSAGNHDGTFDGGTLAQPGARPGTGTCVRFDGVDDKVVIPDGPGLTDLRSELSVLCWMNADQFVGVQRFFGNDGSWTWGLTGQSVRFTTRTIKDYDQFVGFAPNTWYHVACVFDATFAVTFYVDGSFVGKITGPSQANAPKPKWHIAYKDVANPEWFGGMLDDIQVYDGVLTGADVKYLYDNPGKILGGPIGTNYCGPANSNSTGGSAVISAWGNDVVALDDLTLTATVLPPNESGYFFAGLTQGFVPFPGNTSGNLCLGGKIGRFVTQVASTGANGELSIPVDLMALPMSRKVAAQPGDTWHFQAWFTDGGTSNFTDGISITWQ